MRIARYRADLTIWAFAFGYFAFYAPYSAAVKATSLSLWPGMEGPLSRIEILPGFFLGAAFVLFSFITVARWWRFVPRGPIAGFDMPRPRPLSMLSGLGTAIIIAATTLAYTFHGISIVFALLLMRGGVLIMAPVVDTLFRRRVAWNSWLGLLLSLLAVSIALADQDSYVLSLAAMANLAAYLVGYAIRLQCVTAIGKSPDPEDRYRYFAEEQTVSIALLVIGCIGLTIHGALGSPAAAASPLQALAAMFPVQTLVIGVLYGCLFIFGSMIYLDARENCFCIPINRCSSVVAGLVASFAMAYALGLPAVSNMQLLASGIIVAAILVLAQPALAAESQRLGPPARSAAARLLLFVCDGNVSRSPIAAAICNSELARRLRQADTAEFEVASAGLSATPNRPMVRHARRALDALRVTPGDHASRTLSADMVDRAAVIFCMSPQQSADLIARYPQAAGKVRCLDHEREIANPTGRPLDDYHACARHIRASVRRHIAALLHRGDEPLPAASRPT